MPEEARQGCLPQPTGCACCQPPCLVVPAPAPGCRDLPSFQCLALGSHPERGSGRAPTQQGPGWGCRPADPRGRGADRGAGRRRVSLRRPRPHHLPPNPSPGTGSIPAPGHGKHLPPALGLINLLPPPSPSTRHFLPATARGRGRRRQGLGQRQRQRQCQCQYQYQCRLRPTGPRRAPLPRQAQSRWLSAGGKAAAVP